jgi:hypothetical protein
MGEASRKRIRKQSRAGEIETLLSRLGIDYSHPGFFDTPEFRAHENADRRFLDIYAEWVLSRPRSAEEDARVRDVLPRLAGIIVARLERHDWIGGCVAVTGMVSRMLDRMGIWNCAFRGSATVTNTRTRERRHFAIVDESQGTGYQTGHMWLAVPPFDLVDMTLRYQHWEQDAFRESISPVLLAEKTDIVQGGVEDLVAPKVRRMYCDPELLTKALPDQKRFSGIFPARRFVQGNCEYRLAPSGVSVTDGPLEQINSLGQQGAPAIEIWRDDVAPAFNI